jgi:hypothetical protein
VFLTINKLADVKRRGVLVEEVGKSEEEAGGGSVERVV